MTVQHTAGPRRIDPARCSSPQPARSPTAAAAGILGVAGVPRRVHLRAKALRCYNCVSRGRSEPSNGQRATRADPDKASSVGPGALETRAEPARYAVLPAVQTRHAMVRRSQTCLASAPVALLSRGAYQELGRRQGGKPKRTPFGALFGSRRQDRNESSQPCSGHPMVRELAGGASRTHGDVPEPSAGPFEKVENLNLNLKSNGYTY